jgi:pyridoxal phosphate enzyme (YggS family)
MGTIAENIAQIKEKISNAAIKAGRNPSEIKLMAVSKFHNVEEIQEAIDSGITLFGENRVQEAKEKFPQLLEKNPNIELHLIGSLQSNKVKAIVPLASCIQSVDRLSLIPELIKACTRENKKISVLFEVHTGEESKSGFTDYTELLTGVRQVVESKIIVPMGLMTMAPFTQDTEVIRSSFKQLKEIQKKLQQNIAEDFPEVMLSELSMGMSGDFEIAIEEGSTLVRVGTAIFGQRNYQ